MLISNEQQKKVRGEWDGRIVRREVEEEDDDDDEEEEQGLTFKVSVAWVML